MRIQSNVPVLAMNYPFALIRLLETLDISAEESLKNTGLSQADLSISEKLITSEQSLALIKNGLSLTGKSDLGLHYGNCLSINTHGIFGMAVLSCKTLDVAFTFLNKFLFLQYPFASYQYIRGTDSSTFDIEITAVGNEGRKFLIEMVFSCIYSTIKLLTGLDRPEVFFEFSGKKPVNQESHKDYLGDNVRFDRPRNAVILPASIRDMLLKFYEPITLGMAVKKCESTLIRVLNRKRMEIRVTDMISNMSVPFPDIEAVARNLNMCSRTVRRKLKLEGVTYQEILDEKRKKIAIKYLIETDMTITQISTELYFSDSSYFSRAFKRWTGVLPKYYRRCEGLISSNVCE